MSDTQIQSMLLKELIASAVRDQIKDTTPAATMPMGVYCRLYDVSAEAIRQRLQKGVWRLGCEVLEVKGAGRFIDLQAVDKWVRTHGGSTYKAA